MPSPASDRGHQAQSWKFTGLVLVGVTTFLALFVLAGADADWLVAMGDHIRATGSVPDGIPFAEAPTGDWPNALVLAQWVFSLMSSLGVWALPLAQLTAIAGASALLAVSARRMGATDLDVALALVLLVVGSLASFGVARLQLLSFVPFALLLYVLRSETVRPSRRIWLAPALVAIWTNLHGAVLLGVCVLAAYLLFSRLRIRPGESVVVGLTSLAALWATPAGLETGSYYLGVMQNEAAARAEGLWARPSLGNPLDLLMLGGALVMMVAAFRRRLPGWEYVAMAGLSVGTLMAARHGVWLLMFLVGPASLGVRAQRGDGAHFPAAHLRSAASVVICCLGVSAGIVLSRGEEVLSADPEVVEQVASVAKGRVVLAPEPLVESLAVAGVRVWASNPVDAFDADVQGAYLDFLAGRPGMERAVAASGAVVVEDGSAQAEAMRDHQDFLEHELSVGWTVYLRR